MQMNRKNELDWALRTIRLLKLRIAAAKDEERKQKLEREMAEAKLELARVKCELKKGMKWDKKTGTCIEQKEKGAAKRRVVGPAEKEAKKACEEQGWRWKNGVCLDGSGAIHDYAQVKTLKELDILFSTRQWARKLALLPDAPENKDKIAQGRAYLQKHRLQLVETAEERTTRQDLWADLQIRAAKDSKMLPEKTPAAIKKAYDTRANTVDEYVRQLQGLKNTRRRKREAANSSGQRSPGAEPGCGLC
jgi:hypothetical protein